MYNNSQKCGEGDLFSPYPDIILEIWINIKFIIIKRFNQVLNTSFKYFINLERVWEIEDKNSELCWKSKADSYLKFN